MRNATRLSGRLAAIERRMGAGVKRSQAKMIVRLTRNRFERQAAARLVGQMYLREGYLNQKSEGHGTPEDYQHIGFHHLLNEAMVFIATDGQRITGTATTILDSPAGLPLEALYHDTAEVFRRQNLKLGEVCSLAIDPDRQEDTATVLGLIGEVFRCLYMQSGRDVVLITLKPSHAKFYERLGFQLCGPMRLDPRFQHAETVVMSINRQRAGRIMRLLNLAKGKGEEPAFRVTAQTQTPRREPAEILEWCLGYPGILANATASQRRHLLATMQIHSEVLSPSS